MAPSASRRKSIAIGAALGALYLVLVLHVFVRATWRHAPTGFADSLTYLQLAARPLAFGNVFGPKPVLTPLVYHLLGGDLSAILRAQVVFSLIAWSALAFTLLTTRRHWAARVAGLVVAGAFVLAPNRVAFTADLLSESIADSLLALLVAFGLGLAHVERRRPRIALGAGFGVTLAAFLLVRDTNAITVLVACAIVLAYAWTPRTQLLVSGPVLGALFAIATSRVEPDPSLRVYPMTAWAPEMTSRGEFAKVDDFLIRVMPDPAARAAAIEAGLPWEPAFDRFVGQGAYGEFLSEPTYARVRAWIHEHGTGAYVKWLLRHPFARSYELAAAMPALLRGDWIEGDFHPTGYRGNSYGGPLTRAWRASTTNTVVIVLLLLAFPVLLWIRRTHPLHAFVVVLAASALAGLAAAYYGDAMEMHRHCYGAAQQLMLALALAPILLLDRASSPAAS